MKKYIEPILILVLLISCSNAEDIFFDKLLDLNINTEIINSSELTFSEVDAIRSQFMKCWSIPIGMPEDDSLVVKVKISLRQDGSLMKPPEVTDHQRMNDPSQKYFKVIAESALRAVRRCDPIKTPSIERYEKWKTITLNFDPSEILR